MTPPELQSKQKQITRRALQRIKNLSVFWGRRVRVLPRLRVEHTRELTYRARISLIVIATVATFFLFAYVPENSFDGLAFLKGSEDATKLGAFLFIRFVATSMIFLAVWLIRTDDKKVEFQQTQRNMVQSQVSEALGFMMREDPLVRSLGLKRLTDLRKRSTLEESEYRYYTGFVQTWPDIEDQDG